MAKRTVQTTEHRAKILSFLAMLDYAFDQASWHGPNLLSTLRRIRATDAAKMIPGRKNIWEQLLHAAYWKQMVLNKLIGTTPFPRKGSNWPKPPAVVDEKAWKADIQMLREIHAKLRAGVAALSPAQLDAKLERMIIGAALHDIYHTGQIRLLRKLTNKN